MTDLEMTRLCAEAMGWANFGTTRDGTPIVWNKENASTVTTFNPLHDDAQAMALVKKMELVLFRVHYAEEPEERRWEARPYQHQNTPMPSNKDLNRAIVECVAKMQAKK